MARPPPTGRLRPAHVLYVSVRPSPDVQVRRNVTSALELAAQGASCTPITLSLQKKSWGGPHSPQRATHQPLYDLQFIFCLFVFFFLDLDGRHINEDISFGVYLIGTDFPMWTQLKSRHQSNMSRRKQGKPQHLSKREFSRKWRWIAFWLHVAACSSQPATSCFPVVLSNFLGEFQ